MRAIESPGEQYEIKKQCIQGLSWGVNQGHNQGLNQDKSNLFQAKSMKGFFKQGAKNHAREREIKRKFLCLFQQIKDRRRSTQSVRGKIVNLHTCQSCRSDPRRRSRYYLSHSMSPPLWSTCAYRSISIERDCQ